MVIKRKKLCAGCNEEKFIYKNIDGKKYCMSCTYKLQPRKQIKKMSQKQVFKMSLKKQVFEEDKKFYADVWTNRFFSENKNIPGTYHMLRPPCCEACGEKLSHEPNLMYFHHILEKRNYPELRHVEENIAIVCPECHNMYETFPDKVPYLKEKREKLMRSELIKKILQRTPSF